MSTLIATTRSGVRPLGVRGEPLHNSAAQISRVVRRRLGDDAADLLAEPQLHEDGGAIDWYAAWPGEVRQVANLKPAERSAILVKVDAALADIGRLGQTLKGAGDGEDVGVVGRSLQLAAKRPAESFVFLVGDKPVVVCWGYEREAANALLPASLPKAPIPPTPILSTPVAQHVPVLAPTMLPVAAARAATIPWARTLLAALPLLLLLLAGAWLLRELLPADPTQALALNEGGPRPAAPAVQDPLPVLKASLGAEQARAKALAIEIGDVEGELKKRVADCRPPEPPKPPQTAMVQPKPAPPPAVAPPPQQQPPQYSPRAPGDNRLRMPSTPTNDYSFMAGCWRTDPFRHERVQAQAGVSSYCFDANGRGNLEWRRGRTACRTRAQAQFSGMNLALRDADTTCNDGTHWYADQLTCQRGADNVANCSGSSQGAFGPTSWTVNLHKVD
jgi:hypothetical protein